MNLLRARCLIAVDDNPAVLDALTDELVEHGFIVAGTAPDAEAGIVLAAATLPDLAIVDVMMPGGGAVAAAGIRDVSGHTVVVALSAYDHATARAELHAAGAQAYLVKGRDDIIGELLALAAARGWR